MAMDASYEERKPLSPDQLLTNTDQSQDTAQNPHQDTLQNTPLEATQDSLQDTPQNTTYEASQDTRQETPRDTSQDNSLEMPQEMSQDTTKKNQQMKQQNTKQQSMIREETTESNNIPSQFSSVEGFWRLTPNNPLDSSQIADLDFSNIPGEEQAEKTDLSVRRKTIINKQESKRNEDKENTTKSLIQTTEPYIPQAKKKRQKKILSHPALEAYNNRFGKKSWSPYLTLKTNTPISIAQLDHFLTKRHATKEMRIQRINETEWTIKTTTQAQSENYQLIKNIHGVNTTVVPNETLNCIYGTASLPKRERIDPIKDKDMILDTMQMRDRKVKDIEIYEIKTKKIQIIKVKYEGDALPSNIPILGELRELREFIPRPMQCGKCWRYGHTTKKCNKINTTCAKCSGQHTTNWECEETRCANCGKEHDSKSNKCIFHQYQTEIRLLQTRNGLNFGQAKFELKLKGFPNPAIEAYYSQTMNSENTNKTPANRTREENNNTEIASNSNKADKITHKSTNEEEPQNAISMQLSHTQITNRFQGLEEQNLRFEQEEESDTDTVTFEEMEVPPRSPPMTKGKRGKSASPPQQNKKKHTNQGELIQGEIQASVYNTAGSYLPSPEISIDKNISKMEQYDPTTPTSSSEDEMTNTSEPKEKNKDKPKENKEENKVRENTTSEKAHKHVRDNPPAHQSKYIQNESDKHHQRCGCHTCFENYISKNDITTHNKLVENIQKFIQEREHCQVHINPPTICNCTTHLKIKQIEHTWHNRLWNELKGKLEKEKGKTEINTKDNNKQN